MDHVVYLDAKAQEMENLLSYKKTMIIRGATGRKLPYGRVEVGDVLYFINNNSEGNIKARGIVASVFNSDKLEEVNSIALVEKNQNKLNLTQVQFKKWAGKRYLVLIEVKDVEEIKSFVVDKSSYGNMDDWLLVEHIKNVMK